MLYISHLYTFMILELFLSVRILEKTPKLFFKYADKQFIDIIDKMPNSILEFSLLSFHYVPLCLLATLL